MHKYMKKIILIVIVAIIAIATFHYVANAAPIAPVPWFTNSTTSPVAFPAIISGIRPPVQASYFTATSTSDTSSFAGDVGIGTINPAGVLEIYKVPELGTNYSLFTLSEDIVGVEIDTIITDEPLSAGYGREGYGGIGWNFEGANYYTFPLWTKYGIALDDWGKVIHEDNQGNVGLGTDTPESKLVVSGSASIGAGFDDLTAPANGLIVEGAVGIGTASITSGQTIDAQGSSFMFRNGGAISVNIRDSSNSQVPRLNFQQLTTTKGFIDSGTGLGSNIHIGTGSTRVLTINGTNVGISETAPGSKLSVSGGGSFGTSYDTTAAPTNGLIVEGLVGFGTSTPRANFQATNSSANATTSIQLGKPSQNKGTCLTFYDTAGAPVYGFFPAGSVVITYTSTLPSGCVN